MSAGRSLGIGAVGSLGILALGIPALWPLGLIVAGVTHAIVNGSKSSKEDHDISDSHTPDSNADESDTPHHFTLPQNNFDFLNASRNLRPLPRMPEFRLPEEPAFHLDNPLMTFRTTQRQHFGQFNHFLNNDIPETDNQDDEPVVAGRGEPSLRNDLYFQRQRV